MRKLLFILMSYFTSMVKMAISFVAYAVAVLANKELFFALLATLIAYVANVKTSTTNGLTTYARSFLLRADGGGSGDEVALRYS